MKKVILFFVVFAFSSLSAQSSNKYLGLWKNLDDTDGKEKSHIKIYEEQGVLKAQVVKLLPSATLKTCENCKGALKNKPIEGMVVVNGMKKLKDGTYSGGEILDPKGGKTYSCNLALESDDKLKVRGYIGVALMGRTQYWYRVK